jgi:pilus assembly protein Flp/PilA
MVRYQPERWGPIMLDLIRGIVKCQSGATAIEYGLIVSLIVIAMVGALGSFGTSSTGMWDSVSNKVVNAGN